MPYFPKVHMQARRMPNGYILSLCGRWLKNGSGPRSRHCADLALSVCVEEGWTAVNCDACRRSTRTPERGIHVFQLDLFEEVAPCF
jgi:hypothetical protein